MDGVPFPFSYRAAAERVAQRSGERAERSTLPAFDDEYAGAWPLTTLSFHRSPRAYCTTPRAETDAAAAGLRSYSSEIRNLIRHAQAVPAPKSAATEKAAPAAVTKPIRIFSTALATFEVVESYGGDAVAKGLAAGVNVVRDQSNGRVYVEKLLALSTPTEHARALAEVDALTQLRTAGEPTYINRMVESFVGVGGPFGHLILEHCNAGTAYDMIKRRSLAGEQPVEALIWHALAGLSKAVFFCHTGVDADQMDWREPQEWNTLCHLDVKPINVFFSHDGGRNGFPRLVLGDFGCATTWKDIQDGTAKRTVQLYGMPTDVWQMGGVMQAIARLMTLPELTSVVRRRACGRLYSRELNDVVSSCMDPDPLKRPTAGQVAREVKKQMEARGLIF
ncbi:hypothetical protein B0A55_09105 [Friedmanniomyces simplex]|uniref:non-specific serine/threonine protein kinase n=1 Tax=Friedmanniomyces simplex TaxID=329884 RepID=A0A4U0WT72_9PEZI|nr:hypothetical protein B0A55_09105 [Friedmanniomyces simplex]